MESDEHQAISETAAREGWEIQKRGRLNNPSSITPSSTSSKKFLNKISMRPPEKNLRVIIRNEGEA